MLYGSKEFCKLANKTNDAHTYIYADMLKFYAFPMLSVLYFFLGVGVILGGLTIFVLKIRGKRVALMIMILQVIAVPLSLSFLMSCPTPQIPGVNLPFSDG